MAHFGKPCFILINLVFKHKVNFKLKKPQKCVLFKTWKKFGKPLENFEKTSGNPVNRDQCTCDYLDFISSTGALQLFYSPARHSAVYCCCS